MGEGLHELIEESERPMSKIKLKETVIVEGRYDRIKLSELIASPMIETGGFRVFKDKEKQELIRAVARRRGILVMTDVDSAGFVIRNFLRGIVPQEQILHAYIPTIKGKEKRKQEASKEGILGVEGIDRDALIESIRNSGAHIINSLPLVKGGGSAQADSEGWQNCTSAARSVDHQNRFLRLRASGCANAAVHREEVLASLGLPKYLSANAMLAAMNCLFTKEEFEQYLSQL